MGEYVPADGPPTWSGLQSVGEATEKALLQIFASTLETKTVSGLHDCVSFLL